MLKTILHAENNVIASSNKDLIRDVFIQWDVQKPSRAITLGGFTFES